MSDELKQLVTEQRTLWEQFKTKNDETIAEVKKYGEAGSETKAAVDAMQKRFDEIEVEMKRVKLEGAMSAVDAQKAAADAQVKAFTGWMRKGDRLGAEEIKSLSSDSSVDGGYLIAQNIANQIIQKLILVSPIRSMATVGSISQGDSLDLPAEDSTSFSSGWTSERGSRTTTTTGTLRMVTIPTHEQYAMPAITQKLLDDSAFDVEAWVSGRIATAFAVTEGLAFVSGTGVGQPEGLLTNSSVSETNSGSAAALTFDGLMDIYHALPTFYSHNAKWLMNRGTMGAVRKLKDGEGEYFLVPDPTNGGAWMILGDPVVETPAMPDVAAGTYPIIYGDIAKAYQIVDRKGITMLRDPYSSKPNILFYTTARTGGAVVLPEAIRKQKVSA